MKVCPSLFIILSSAAISWSAVPEQPLDVTSDGFRQGTTKKRIGSHQSRCENVAIIWMHVSSLLAYTCVSAHDVQYAVRAEKSREWREKEESREQKKRKNHCVRERRGVGMTEVE